MLKDLLKEGGLYTLANLLTKGVSLMLIPFYTAYFSTSDYGIIGMLGVFGGFASAIMSFQVYQGLGRYIAEEKPLEEKRKIGSTAIIFTAFSFAAFFLIVILFKNFFIQILSSDVKISEDLLLLSTFSISLNAIFYALGIQLKYLRKVNQFALSSFLHSIFNILLIIYLVLQYDLGIKSIFFAGIIVGPIIIMLQIYYLKNYLYFYLGLHELKKLLQFSTPLIPAAIAYLILNLTDRFFIKEISMSANGIYEVAFKFSSIISIILVAFQSALAPILYQKHELSSTKIELANIFKLFFGIGTIGVLILSLFSFETLYVFTQPEYYDAQFIMPIFYISLLITGLGLFSPGLHIKHKTKIIPLVVISSALINILLNYILVNKFQLIGAAIATLVSVFINNISLFIISQKLYKTPYPIKIVLWAITFFLFFIFIDFYLKYNFQGITLTIILIKLAVVLIYGFLLIKLKIFNLKKLMRRKNAKN